MAADSLNGAERLRAALGHLELAVDYLDSVDAVSLRAEAERARKAVDREYRMAVDKITRKADAGVERQDRDKAKAK